MNLIQRARSFRKQHSLGQNFLVDEKILDQIVLASKITQDDVIIEVGPGIGFLTEKIIPLCKELYSVELDRNTIPYLKILKAANANFHYLRDDFLALSIEDILSFNSFEQKKKILLEQSDVSIELDDEDTELLTEAEKTKSKVLLQGLQAGDFKIKIVANIPYQISSRILLHLLGEIGEESANKKYISEINILVQKEFADKLVAKPGTKAYSSLTILVNYWAEVERCVEVPSSCFLPAPKVDSSFIKLRLKDKPSLDINEPKQVRRFIKAIFSNRRKKLTNGLKAAGFSSEEIKQLDLPENLRGETLSLEEIVGLVSKLSS